MDNSYEIDRRIRRGEIGWAVVMLLPKECSPDYELEQMITNGELGEAIKHVADLRRVPASTKDITSNYATAESWRKNGSNPTPSSPR